MSWQPDPTEGPLPLFRALDDQEEQKFREYARQNDPEDLDKWEMYHPVCREEWMNRGFCPLEKHLA